MYTRMNRAWSIWLCVCVCACVCVCVGVGAWACVRKFNSWKLQFISTTANVTGTMSNQIKSTEYRKIQKRMVLYMYISTIFSNSKEAIASWQVDIVLWLLTEYSSKPQQNSIVGECRHPTYVLIATLKCRRLKWARQATTSMGKS